jgi:RILP-like protein 1
MEANRPRFTLEELRQVLWERNDLKTKLMEVEEELRLFKEQYVLVSFSNYSRKRI